MNGMGINKDVNGKYYSSKGIDDIINDSMSLPPDNKDHDKIIQIFNKIFSTISTTKSNNIHLNFLFMFVILGLIIMLFLLNY